MKILIAEDDPVTRDSIDECLRGEGFSTLLASDGNEAIQLWRSEEPDLACLDIMMPNVDGYEVCRQIRSKDKQIPILFLSAKNEEIDVVVGLEIGADDFIRKPFGKHELLARVRSALRRSEAARDVKAPRSPNTFDIRSELTIYPAQLRAIRHSNGEEIDLSPREISILQVLSERLGEAVSRDELLNRCWGMNYYPESRTLDQHIAKLRKRICPEDGGTPLIETVRGVGYRIREHAPS
ncbi:MAG: DNA-binding response regulator [Verrucomicrobiales bacterium]|nr:DNA-binding response regulator [Verrucomicrobiales bacterium]